MTEVEVSRFVIADNLARLAWSRGDRAGARHWQAVCEAADARIPPWRAPDAIWSLQHTIDNNLAGALRHFELRRARAEARLSPMDAAWMAHLLGDCCYRLGRPADARRYFGEALAAWRRLGDEPFVLLQTEMNCAISAFRAGRYAESHAGFVALLTNSLVEPGDMRADLLAGLAWVTGYLHGAAAAAAHLAAARAEAPSPAVAARIARAEGEIALVNGDRAGARDAFARALALADESPPEDRFGLLGALLAVDGGAPESRARLEEALVLAPDALADPNAWWDLARVVTAAAEMDDTSTDPAVRAGLARLLGAAGQREDAAEAALRVEERWGIAAEL